MVGIFVPTDIGCIRAHEKAVKNEIIEENPTGIDASGSIEASIPGAVGHNGSDVGAGK